MLVLYTCTNYVVLKQKHAFTSEHAVSYGENRNASGPSKQRGDTQQEPPKFIDTLNPLLSFSNDDLDAMNNDFEECFESDDDSSSDEEPVDIENPPMNKTLRKRKRREEKENRRNIFKKQEEEGSIIKYSELEENDNSQTNLSSDEDESPSAKFRRGCALPSDLDMGSNSEGSEEPLDDVDDGDWNMMGAALEREFLGLDE